MLLGIPIHNQAQVESAPAELRFPPNSNSHHSCHPPIVFIYDILWLIMLSSTNKRFSQLQLTHLHNSKRSAKYCRRVRFWFGPAENLSTIGLQLHYSPCIQTADSFPQSRVRSYDHLPRTLFLWTDTRLKTERYKEKKKKKTRNTQEIKRIETKQSALERKPVKHRLN